MDKVISELVSYGMLNGLITEDDKVTDCWSCLTRRILCGVMNR